MTNETAISVSLHTSSFRGDHAADIRKDYDLLPGETVPELMKRVKGDWPGGDHIELRVKQGRAI
jgi:hypothetical protein